jgi:hypothetical protein
MVKDERRLIQGWWHHGLRMRHPWLRSARERIEVECIDTPGECGRLVNEVTKVDMTRQREWSSTERRLRGAQSLLTDIPGVQSSVMLRMTRKRGGVES